LIINLIIELAINLFKEFNIYKNFFQIKKNDNKKRIKIKT